jgi:hypothetical protein
MSARGIYLSSSASFVLSQTEGVIFESSLMSRPPFLSSYTCILYLFCCFHFLASSLSLCRPIQLNLDFVELISILLMTWRLS